MGSEPEENKCLPALIANYHCPDENQYMHIYSYSMFDFILYLQLLLIFVPRI